MTFILTPQPVPCANCGAILKATYRDRNMGLCPGVCGEPACYTCGCTQSVACMIRCESLDGEQVTEEPCEWYSPGLCNYCYWETAYVLYMELTARVPDDPFYLRTYEPGATHHVAP